MLEYIQIFQHLNIYILPIPKKGGFIKIFPLDKIIK